MNESEKIENFCFVIPYLPVLKMLGPPHSGSFSLLPLVRRAGNFAQCSRMLGGRRIQFQQTRSTFVRRWRKNRAAFGKQHHHRQSAWFVGRWVIKTGRSTEIENPH